MSVFKFIFSHSFFISLCAAALCYQTCCLFDLTHQFPVYRLVFFATLCAYNLYWLMSKFHFIRIDGFFSFLKAEYPAVSLTLISGIIFLYQVAHLPKVFPVVGISVALTLLYSIPLWPGNKNKLYNQTGFLKTIILALTWSLVTTFIPLAASAENISNSAVLFFVTRCFWMLILCIIFDSRDVQVDKLNSLHSLATFTNPKTLRKITWLIFLLYNVCLALSLYRYGNVAFCVASFVTGIVTMLVYRASFVQRGYYFYYFLVDGLMLFSAFLTFIATI